MFNQNDLPALIPPHGGYRKLRSVIMDKRYAWDDVEFPVLINLIP